MDGMTEEELESLSESERLALAEAGEDGGLTGNDPHSAGEDDDDETDVEALAAIAAGADDDTDAAAEPAAAANEPPEDPPEFTPRLVAEAPADADAKFAEINGRKEALRTQLNEGDIGLDEYTAQYDAIGKEERALERQVWEAESAQKQNQQADGQRWQWEQEQFFADPANAAYKDKYLLTALDAAIKDLANDPANGSRKGPWFLSEANKMIRERFGMAKPVDIPGDKPDAGREAANRRRVQAPPTLAGMPSAELPETGGGDEFAHLDKLTGFELEAALARMPQDQQDRYLSA